MHLWANKESESLHCACATPPFQFAHASHSPSHLSWYPFPLSHTRQCHVKPQSNEESWNLADHLVPPLPCCGPKPDIYHAAVPLPPRCVTSRTLYKMINSSFYFKPPKTPTPQNHQSQYVGCTTTTTTVPWPVKMSTVTFGALPVPQRDL